MEMAKPKVSPTPPMSKAPRDTSKTHEMFNEIRIADFNFDIDGDGVIDPFEKKVMAAFKAADRDNSGTLTPVEMLDIMRKMAESAKTNKRMGRTIWGLIALVAVLVLALLGVSIAGAVVGGEAIKESKVPDCSNPSEEDEERCDPANLVSVGQVESFTDSLFLLPTAPINQLSYLREVSFYVDMTDDADVGGLVEATYKIAGAYKRSNDKLVLETTNNHKIVIDAAAQSASIKMNGISYPVHETEPESSGRKLETLVDGMEPPLLPTFSSKQIAIRREENRRKLGFFSALQTSGSFTMMQAGGFRRGRKLGFFSALQTSGSFTMMQAGGF
jgi:hypothetical protein